MKNLLKFIAPLLLLMLCESLFRLGIWEGMVKPDSHSGTSVRLKRALNDPAMRQLDFVTLGSSRPVYGIDHEALARIAQEHGVVHANLSMPGSHWMTVDVLTNWLAAHRPNLRGGVIAMDLTTFMYPGNGSYELAIVAPFRGFADDAVIASHVPAKRDEMASWGAHSALYQYREDIQDYIKAPLQRRESVQWWKGMPAADVLLRNPKEARDMCEFGADRVAACDKVDSSTTEAANALRHQCRELRSALAGRPDFAALMRQQPMPDFLRQVRDNVRSRLRALNWPRPPAVALMPLTGAWKEASPLGLHEWTLSVLQPLVDEGRIRLIDATDALATAENGGCRQYFDFFHQNDSGRQMLMDAVLPQIRSALYDEPPTPAARTAASGK